MIEVRHDENSDIVYGHVLPIDGGKWAAYSRQFGSDLEAKHFAGIYDTDREAAAGVLRMCMLLRLPAQGNA